MIKLRILRWREYPGLSRWVQCKHKYPYKREAERALIREEKSHAMTEAEGSTVSEREDTMPLAWKICLWLGRWRKRPEDKEYRWPLKNRKGKAMDSPPKPPGGALNLALLNSFQTSGIQNGTRINSCCFEPSGLGQYVTAATRN